VLRHPDVIDGSREIGFTVLSISFSLIAVFIPLLLMGGIIGRLFREFAITVTAPIAVSALVSLTLETCSNAGWPVLTLCKECPHALGAIGRTAGLSQSPQPTSPLAKRAC
jgi:hypothetical protein